MKKIKYFHRLLGIRLSLSILVYCISYYSLRSAFVRYLTKIR